MKYKLVERETGKLVSEHKTHADAIYAMLASEGGTLKHKIEAPQKTWFKQGQNHADAASDRSAY